MTAAALRRRVDAVLKKTGASFRVAYLRKYTRTGGDPVTGAGAVVSTDDIRLNPQPAIATVSEKDLSAISSGIAVQTNDQIAMVSATALSKELAKDKDIVFLLVDSLGNEEEFSPVGVFPVSFGSDIVAYRVLLRSRKR